MTAGLHPVDALKSYMQGAGVAMTTDTERRLREMCDEQVDAETFIRERVRAACTYGRGHPEGTTCPNCQPAYDGIKKLMAPTVECEHVAPPDFDPELPWFCVACGEMQRTPRGPIAPARARKGDWMQTHSGRQYWPLDPSAAEVHVPDIAWHLSMICRYLGACLRFYSVLEHSLGVLAVLTAWLRADGYGPNVARNFKLCALFHDAPEAYCHDLIRPIKRCVQGYDEIEDLNYAAIAQAVGLRGLWPEAERLLKMADNAMLLAEQARLMAPKPAEWAPIDVHPVMLDAAHKFLRAQRYMPWRRSGWWLRREFARRYRELRAAA